MITLHLFRDFSRIGMSLLSLCAVANALDAAAQPFPSKIIRIVVPTGSSTPPDIISRVIAAELSESEGWRVVVENRPGAIQSIGVADILKQNADDTRFSLPACR